MSKAFSLAPLVSNVFPCTWDLQNFGSVSSYDNTSVESFISFNDGQYSAKTHDSVCEALNVYCSTKSVHQGATITNIASICNIPIIIIDGLFPWATEYEPAVQIMGLGILFSRQCDQIRLNHEMVHCIQDYMCAMGHINMVSKHTDDSLTWINKIFLRIKLEFQAYVTTEPGVIGTDKLDWCIKALTGNSYNGLTSLLSEQETAQLMTLINYLRQIEYLTHTCNQNCNIAQITQVLFETYDLSEFLSLI
jgi:hypothetical protein